MNSFRLNIGALLGSGLAILATCGATVAADQPPKGKQSAILHALADCRTIVEPAGRLACFDKATAELIRAETTGEVVVVDRKQIREARKQAFGLDLSAIAFFDRGATREALNNVTDEVTSAFQGPQGRWVMTLRSGAIWRQTDSEELVHPPRPGSKVVISRASLGSFMMEVESQPIIRVRREH